MRCGFFFDRNANARRGARGGAGGRSRVRCAGDRLVAAKADRRQSSAAISCCCREAGGTPAGRSKPRKARLAAARQRKMRPQAAWRDAQAQVASAERPGASSLDDQLTSTQDAGWPADERRRTWRPSPAAQIAQLRAAITRLRTQQQQLVWRATGLRREWSPPLRAGANHGRGAHRGAERGVVSHHEHRRSAGRAGRSEPATRSGVRRCRGVKRRDRRRQRFVSPRHGNRGRRWSRTRTRRRGGGGRRPVIACLQTSQRRPSGNMRRCRCRMCRCSVLPVRLETRFDRHDGRRSCSCAVPGHGSRRHARAGPDGGGFAPRTPVLERSARLRKRRRQACGVAPSLPISSVPSAPVDCTDRGSLRIRPGAQTAGRVPRRRTSCPTGGSRSATATASAGSLRSAARYPTASRRARPQNCEPGSAAPLGEGARWLVDFERDVQAGMALRIPLARR